MLLTADAISPELSAFEDKRETFFCRFSDRFRLIGIDHASFTRALDNQYEDLPSLSLKTVLNDIDYGYWHRTVVVVFICVLTKLMRLALHITAILHLLLYRA